MLEHEAWNGEAVLAPDVVADHRVAGGQGMAFGRSLVALEGHLPHHAGLPADPGTLEKLAISTRDPVVTPDIEQETRFTVPDFMVEHGIRSLVNVLVIGVDGRPPYGVLEVDSREQRQFSEDDVSFLRTYANMLSAAVERLRADEEVRNRATDNERLQAEGQAQQSSAHAKQAGEHVKDAAGDIKDAFK